MTLVILPSGLDVKGYMPIEEVHERLLLGLSSSPSVIRTFISYEALYRGIDYHKKHLQLGIVGQFFGNYEFNYPRKKELQSPSFGSLSASIRTFTIKLSSQNVHYKPFVAGAEDVYFQKSLFSQPTIYPSVHVPTSTAKLQYYKI
jgi:hypothetical protein